MQIEQTQGQPKKSFFKTVFSRGNVEITGFTELESNPQTRRSLTDYIKIDRLKKLLLVMIILAITLTVLLIVKQITAREQTEVLAQGLSVDKNDLESKDNDRLVINRPDDDQTGLFESDPDIESRRMSAESDVEVESRVTPSTTTTTTPTSTTTTRSTTPSTTTTTTSSTTESPTTAEPQQVLDHLSVSITINNGSVPNKDAYVSKTDTYVKVYADDHYIGQTPVQKETLKPEWNYQIAHQMTLRPDSVLRFELYDNDKYTSHEFIGKFLVRMSELVDSGSNGVLVNREHGSGRLWFAVSWTEVYRKE